MKKYYLHNGTAQEGPYDLHELKDKGLKAGTYVWPGTWQIWMPAGEVRELKSLFSATPPPFPLQVVPSDGCTPPPFEHYYVPPANRKRGLVIGAVAAGVMLLVVTVLCI